MVVTRPVGPHLNQIGQSWSRSSKWCVSRFFRYNLDSFEPISNRYQYGPGGKMSFSALLGFKFCFLSPILYSSYRNLRDIFFPHSRLIYSAGNRKCRRFWRCAWLIHGGMILSRQEAGKFFTTPNFLGFLSILAIMSFLMSSLSEFLWCRSTLSWNFTTFCPRLEHRHFLAIMS